MDGQILTKFGGRHYAISGGSRFLYVCAVFGNSDIQEARNAEVDFSVLVAKRGNDE